MHKQTDGSLNLGGKPLADLRNIGKLCSLSVRCKIDAANPMQQQPPSSSALDLVEQNPFATWLLALSELGCIKCRLPPDGVVHINLTITFGILGIVSRRFACCVSPNRLASRGKNVAAGGGWEGEVEKSKLMFQKIQLSCHLLTLTLTQSSALKAPYLGGILYISYR